MIKLLSIAFTLTTLLFLSLPNAASAQEKRPYSTHIRIMKHFMLSQSTAELYNTKVLGLRTKQIQSKSIVSTKTEKQPAQANVQESPSTDALAYIMQEINAYRASHGLGAVRTSAETCAFAATRAQEVTASFSHDGFQSRADAKTLPYNSWSGVTENLAMDAGYNEVVNMWANSPGHAANMRADTPFVCVRQNGNYFAYEGMKP